MFDYLSQGYLKSEAASLCARRLRSAPVRFQRSPYGGARVGVSAVRFDARGDLVAVAGSNGIIRVFEFLECLGRLQAGSTAEVPAVVVLDAKKDIAGMFGVAEEEEGKGHPIHRELLEGIPAIISAHM